MKLLKPKWVNHAGKPIFTIDVHPDGTRFATGGQADDTGRISIWNMAPVIDAKDEADENIPKMLCLLDNHSGCVNCVRWSNGGKYLASGADDKFIMIWQIGRGFGPSTVFGSSGTVVNIEQWRCVHVLRGHTGDVLDLAWSPDDRFLASGSVDNTVHMWNAEKFPELLTTLRGHQGLVKGVTWDPVGKYFASQSDDKTLKVWRTSDWKLESSVTEPFEECGGTTHVLRLNWSPDGQYVVSAHAMNNGGPVAKIVERDGWKARMDFVGHRKAITCVRFNSRLFTKTSPTDPSKFKQYACCAIGSRDRTLSVWLTSLKRPLVVTHDFFESSIMDLSWSHCGYRVLACSLDGTVAYLGFSPEEIGKSMTDQEKLAYHKQTYGTSIVSSKNNVASSIIENPEVLKVHQQQQQQERVRKAMLAQQSRLQSPSAVSTAASHGSKSFDKQRLSKSGSFTSGSSDDSESAMMILKRQKETKTKDGKRRITPLMLAPPLDISDNEPMPFGADESAAFVNNGSPIKRLENQDPKLIARAMLKSPPIPSPTTPTKSIITAPPVKKLSTSLTSSTTSQNPPQQQQQQQQQSSSSAATATIAVSSAPVKRKLDTGNQTPIKRGRKEKDKTKEKSRNDAFIVTRLVDDKAAENSASGLTRPSSPHHVLQHPKVEKTLSVKVTKEGGISSGEIVYEIENTLHAGGLHASALHALRCTKSEKLTWETFLTSPITALAGTRCVVAVSCQNKSIHTFSKQGRRVMPGIFLASHIAILHCNDTHVLAFTSSGNIHVWDITKQKATISNESIHHLLKGASITRAFLTQNGVPVLSLSDSSAYSYSPSLCAWTQLASVEDALQLSSSYSGCVPSQNPSGVLQSLQTPVSRLTRQTTGELRMCSSKQQSCTMSHLENQICASITLGSAEEYHFWLMTYARYLVQSGEESRLREVCEDLLGPSHRKNDSTLDQKILTFRKRDLLQEVLPIIASNLRFQRLYTEFKDQLEYLTKR